jgi:hypothetical protein
MITCEMAMLEGELAAQATDDVAAFIAPAY